MNQGRTIKVISFDGDMTLWDFQKVMRHALAITLDELRYRVPGEASSNLNIDKMIEIRNQVAAELKGRVINLEEIRFQAFRRTTEVIGCPDDSLAADLNALYLKHRFEDIELYSDVIPILYFLSQRYTIGLLSNGNSYPDRCGLQGLFSFVIFSQDVGVEKPDAGMFSAVCEQTGCTASGLLHVGDSLEKDVAGANQFGAFSVWLNREAARNDLGVSPDHEIESLAELPALLL